MRSRKSRVGGYRRRPLIMLAVGWLYLVSLLSVCGQGSGPPPIKPQPKLLPQLGHFGFLGQSSMTLSSDGKWLATGGGFDKTARLWEAATGREIRVFEGHTDQVTAVALSKDGKWLVTGGWDDTARLWEVATGKQIHAYRHNSDGQMVRSVTLSDDGKWLATGSFGAARLWEVATGKLIRVFRGHEWGIDAVVLSKDGKWLVTGGDDARLWNAMTGQLVFTFKAEAEPSSILCAAISKDGNRLVLGSWQTAHLWDLAERKFVRSFSGHSLFVQSVALSPDGKWLATGSSDCTACLWELATGKKVNVFRGHTQEVNSVAFSADSKLLFTGSHENISRLWDVATGKEIRAFRGHAHDVRQIALSSDGKWLATQGEEDEDGPVCLWDLAAGKQARLIRKCKVSSIALSDDGKVLVTGEVPGDFFWEWSWGVPRAWPGHGLPQARSWDTTTGRELRVFIHPIPRVHAAVLSRDGKWLATANGERNPWDMNARLWDLATGKQLHVLKHFDAVYCLAFSVDGSLLLTGGHDGFIRFWDPITGKEVRKIEGQGGRITGLGISDDGRCVVAGGLGGAGLWELKSGKEIRSFLHDEVRSIRSNVELFSLALSRDGKLLVTTGTDFTMVWDLATGKKLRVLPGIKATVSRDGKVIITCHLDNTTRLWELASGKELCRLVSFRDGTWAVFDSLGRFDAANDGDINNLCWVIGNDLVPLKQFRDRYHEPGLLAKYLGFKREPLGR
jgi:WD40 repeat protein